MHIDIYYLISKTYESPKPITTLISSTVRSRTDLGSELRFGIYGQSNKYLLGIIPASAGIVDILIFL